MAHVRCRSFPLVLYVMARAGELKANASWEPPAAPNPGVTVRAGLSYHKVNRGGAYDIFLFLPPSLRNKMLTIE